MKQLLILSGKGGTGKTTIASAFIDIKNAKAYADCDVDAPNLHLVTDIADDTEKQEFYGLQKAHIDTDICINCDICRQHCRFNAINDHPFYSADIIACEGCAVCTLVCPVNAVTMHDHAAGEMKLYKNENRVFSTASLYPGNGNSGLLVSRVKKRLNDNILPDTDFSIIDGSPGIGCPVIASLSGVDMVLIVAEPSLSGISDMERIIKTARGFETDIAVCVNKYDLNVEMTDNIKKMCDDSNIAFVGTIAYDKSVIDIVNKGFAVTSTDNTVSKSIRTIYKNVIDRLTGVPE